MAKVERHNVSDFFKNIIPPRPPPPTISPAEFIALRAIVMSLVAATASHYQASVGEPAQDFINFIAASSQEAILGADISGGDAGDLERMRREAADLVNHILGGIHPPIDRDNRN